MSKDQITSGPANGCIRSTCPIDRAAILLDLVANAIAEGIDDLNEGQPLRASDYLSIAQTVLDNLDQEGFHVCKS